MTDAELQEHLLGEVRRQDDEIASIIAKKVPRTRAFVSTRGNWHKGYEVILIKDRDRCEEAMRCYGNDFEARAREYVRRYNDA